MSEDDMKAPDCDFEDDGSDDDDDAMDDYNPPLELPEGVTKEIVAPAPPDAFKKPKRGSEVTVHYVGTLESDDSEFDSSRARDSPFTFTLGKGQVIKGWDVGVASMKKGEIARFTLAPEFAYGDQGSPPKIPEKATLVFEVELISWVDKDDLFGDEGVIKTQLKEGSGWKMPQDGEEVLISLKAVAADGSVIEERSSYEYVLGSGALGPLEKTVQRTLKGMKKGEEAELKCSKDYSYGDERPDGCTVTLTMQEVYETKDVSIGKDKSLMKKHVREGEGYETPKDTSKIKLSVEAATDGSAALPGFEAKVLEFVLGNGEVCDALEFATGQMKKGERAVLTVEKAALASEPQLGLKDLSVERLVLTIELVEFEKAEDTWNMQEDEKVAFGGARKEVGSGLFKNGRLALALQCYKKVGELLSYVDNFNEENKAKSKELKKVCELNKAACYLKLNNYDEALKACDSVLKDEKSNVKALYRRAQAELGLKNYSECIRDCKRVVDVDPQNKDARALVIKAKAGQKEVDKQSKGLFANMCKALGKLPTPATTHSKAPDGDEGELDEDEMRADDDADAEMGEAEANAEPEQEAATAA